MIGAFRSNLGKGHDFFPIDIKFRFKIIGVPILKQSNIQADMRWIQSGIYRKLQKHSIEMFNVIDIFQNDDLIGIMNPILFQ